MEAAENKLTGKFKTKIVGPGAAPFGIASAIIGGTSIGYNLALLQNMVMPGQTPIGKYANETYDLKVWFAIKAKGENVWVLDRAEFDYTFDDKSRIDYDEAEIADSMHDSGKVFFMDGTWSGGPPDWEPEADPEVRLELFEAGSAAECEDGPPTGFLATAKTIFIEEPVTCYQFSVQVVHPMRPNGESHWSSPMGSVNVTADDGTLRFSLDSPIKLRDMKGVADKAKADVAKMDPKLADEMGQFMEGMKVFEKFLTEDMPEVDAGIDMVYDRTFRGVAKGGEASDSDTYTILSGAQAFESFNVPIVQPFLKEANKSWIPQVDKTIKIKAYLKGKKTPVDWKFTLFDITKEPDVCVNCNKLGDDNQDDPDLEFDENANSGKFKKPERVGDDSWVIETSRPVEQVTVVVKANDYGAWGKLKAEAAFSKDDWVEAEVEDKDKDEITIPYEEEGKQNYIADQWEKDHDLTLGQPETTDDDDSPHSDYEGDGFSLYEEYRGFSAKGDWSRTSPKKKDLFVHVVDNELESHVTKFQSVSEIKVHKIIAKEFVSDGERWVNFNSSDKMRVVKQHGLVVKLGELARGVGGEAERDNSAGNVPDGTENGSPAFTTFITVDKRHHRKKEGKPDPQNIQETTVHEMLHGVAVEHHGDGDRNYFVCKKADGSFTEHCVAPGDIRVEAFTAFQHGEHSGNQQCYIAYDTASFYMMPSGQLAQGANGILTSFQFTKPLNTICDGKGGTGHNENGLQVGGTEGEHHGECKRQIKVSDK